MFSVAPPPSLLIIALSVILLVAGVGIVAYVLFILITALVASFGGTFEQSAFRRYQARCEKGDQLLEKGDLAGAVRIFGDAFFLKLVRRNHSLLSDIANYHTGLLSRLLTVADEMGKGRARLPSLAEVDRLLAQRLDLHLDYFRARKREDDQRCREIERQLRENETHVRAAISRLIEEIRSSEERVLYH
jgi:Na+-transporting methylmalonyl-CoA/oxaloacetate decarboxylase gamma subunit